MYVLAPIKHHNFEIKNRKREKSYLTRRRQTEKIRETEIDFRKFFIDKERGAGEAKILFERGKEEMKRGAKFQMHFVCIIVWNDFLVN
jgi:hypothetical protein